MRFIGMPIANDDQETFKDIKPTNNVIHAPKSEKGTSSTSAKPATMTRVSTWTTNSAYSNPKAIPNRTFLSVSAKTPPSDSSIEELSDENRRQKLYHETLQIERSIHRLETTQNPLQYRHVDVAST